MASQADYDKIKTQLLDLMSAAQKVFDCQQSKNSANQAAMTKLKAEYVKAAVMLKSMNSTKIPALLNPQHGILTKLDIKEGLTIDMDEE